MVILMIKPKETMRNDWGMVLGLENIFLPLRGFPSESDAATLALRLAECAGANITLLHFKPREKEVSKGYLELKKRIEHTANMLNVHLQSVLEPSDSPKKDIVKQIKKMKPDLTIMTTRHEKGFPSTITGSNTSFVVKHSQQPILIVHSLLGDFDSYREIEFENLMILIQKGDTLDDSMVKLAIGFTCKPKALSDIKALHIVTISDKVPLKEFQADKEFQQQEKSFLHIVGQYSQHFGVVFRPKVVLGHSLGKTITYAARTENIDLLLVAVREKLTSWLPWRRGLERTQVYQIAKAAPCTVAFYFPKK